MNAKYTIMKHATTFCRSRKVTAQRSNSTVPGLITSSSSLNWTCVLFRFRLIGTASLSSAMDVILRLCAVLNSVRFYAM